MRFTKKKKFEEKQKKEGNHQPWSVRTNPDDSDL